MGRSKRYLAGGLIFLLLFLQSCKTIEVNESIDESYWQVSEIGEFRENEEIPIKETILTSIELKGGLENKELWLTLTILDFGIRIGLSPVHPLQPTNP